MALYPAVIKTYDAERRRVRIEMVGMTDGETLLPESELLYALGDKSSHTEIEILEGDSVWVDFLADDPRYPIIMGYRNPEVGNSVSWRRFHHENMELSAGKDMILRGDRLFIQFKSINTTGDITNNDEVVNKSKVTNQSSTSLVGGADNGSGGAVRFENDVIAGGISVMNHIHTGDSGGTTSKPR